MFELNMRMPDISLSEFGARRCRLCSSDSLNPVLREERSGRVYNVVRCSACDLIQTAEDYASLSPDYVDLDPGAIDDGRLWCQSAHKVPAFRQWLAAADKMLPSRGGSSVLDVGCGTGGFLGFAATNGLKVYGFDASSAQAEYARRRFPTVRCANSPRSYLSALDAPRLGFDMVTLWDVFEHIRDPIPFLDELSAMLNPGGLLFVSVPNGRAIPWKLALARALGRPVELSPWEHVFYYSPASLKLCLDRAGFEVLRGGAVTCYPRPMSAFEACRRIGFSVLSVLPRFAPQIYAWAGKSS